MEPFDSHDLEKWRDQWKAEMAHLPQDLQQPFPDPSQFKTATHMRNIIELLKQHDIACCIVGIKALCYYGAGRLCEV